MGKKAKDMTGQKFGKLTVISRNIINKGRDAYWNCECSECGSICVAPGSGLRRGRVNYCKTCRDIIATLSPLKTLYGTYKRWAEKRDYCFDLSMEQFHKLIKSDCYYCGSPPSQYLKKKEAKKGIIYNGIDRYDNNKGYTSDNAVPCCKFCNMAKGIHLVEDFQLWLKRVYEHYDKLYSKQADG